MIELSRHERWREIILKLSSAGEWVFIESVRAAILGNGNAPAAVSYTEVLSVITKLAEAQEIELDYNYDSPIGLRYRRLGLLDKLARLSDEQ